METEIRSVMVPVDRGELLIPNATVAEVIGYSQPEALEDAPDWLLGMVMWHGWQVPAVSFPVLAGMGSKEPIGGARFCVTKTLLDTARMPYLAVLAQGFPRLTTVTASNLIEVEDESTALGVLSRVTVGEREAIIPDLERLAQLTAHAAFGELPLTE